MQQRLQVPRADESAPSGSVSPALTKLWPAPLSSTFVETIPHFPIHLTSTTSIVSSAPSSARTQGYNAGVLLGQGLAAADPALPADSTEAGMRAWLSEYGIGLNLSSGISLMDWLSRGFQDGLMGRNPRFTSVPQGQAGTPWATIHAAQLNTPTLLGAARHAYATGWRAGDAARVLGPQPAPPPAMTEGSSAPSTPRQSPPPATFSPANANPYRGGNRGRGRGGAGRGGPLGRGGRGRGRGAA